MKSSRPWSAHCRSQKTRIVVDCVGQPLEERAPGREQLLARFDRQVIETEQPGEARLDPAALDGVRDHLLEHRGEPTPSGLGIVRLGDPRPAADDLGQRPVADAVAVGGRPALVPEDRLDDAVEILLELPGEPALADAGLPDDRHQAGLAFAFRGVEMVLERAQLLVAPDEWRLDRLAAPGTTATRHDGQGLPAGDGRGLALERLLADRLERDRTRRRSVGRLADEDRARDRDRLEPRGRVDEVAGDHPLSVGTDRHDGLPGQDTRPPCEDRPLDFDPADGIDQLEGRPHGAFRVVLVRDRGPPDCHHRVADELLDHPAVAVDDLAGGREVPVEQFADLLRVEPLRQRREPDEVDEHDRDEPDLVHRRRRCGRGRTARRSPSLDSRWRSRSEVGAAFAAELGTGLVGRAACRASEGEPLPALEAELARRVVLRSTVAAGQHQRRIAVDFGHEEERCDSETFEPPEGRHHADRDGWLPRSGGLFEAANGLPHGPVAIVLAIAAAIVDLSRDPAGADGQPPLTRGALRCPPSGSGRHEERRAVEVAATRPAIPSGLLEGGVVAIGRYVAADARPGTSRRPSRTAVCGRSS